MIKKTIIAITVIVSFLGSITGVFGAESVEALQQRVASLEAQLKLANDALGTAKTTIENANDSGPKKIQIGKFKIGGALRANYAIGEYATGRGPTFGAKGGNVKLETFKIDIDYQNGPWSGKIDYRFYDGSNLLHTGWVGYTNKSDGNLQIGVNRVPFGPTAWGVSNSWFFDQHYYVGLADDMDLGIKYSWKQNRWRFDLGYYYSDEGNWVGSSLDSTRYSYDPVVWKYNGQKTGYAERNQFNFRAIGSMTDSTEVGVSLQAGQLKGFRADDGDTYAASIHMKNSWGSWGIKSQLTYYQYNIGSQATGDDELIPFGAFDFAWPIATEGIIPAISINYLIKTDAITWIDSVNLYVEYSSILKSGKTASGQDFKNSDLFVVGAAWARGGWYIYTDLGMSNGNYFVGGDDFTNQGANLNATWQSRVNVNFGYYF